MRIEEVEASVEVMDPTMIKAVVDAVLAELDRRSGTQANQESETDLRSIVDQQRGGRR